MNRELIRKYERFEDENYKLHDNFISTFIFGVFAFIGGILSLMFAFMGAGDMDDMAFVSYMYIMFTVIQMGSWSKVRYSIVENNKVQNFYEKLLYIPVDLKMYCVAQAYRMFKYYMTYAAVVQLVILLIHVLYNGGFKLMWYTFMPIIAGVIATLACMIVLVVEYKNATKHR